MYYIGIDIGGMSIKGGLVTENGELVLKQSIVTRPTANEDVIIDDIHKLICSLLENKGLHEYQLSGVGIGVPGTVDGEKGRVRFTPNINFKNTPLVEKLSARFQYKFPIRISNDANCAALGAAEINYRQGTGFCESVFFSFAAAVGFGFALVIFSGIREKLAHANPPRCFRGIALALVTGGLLSLAFMGFSGLVKLPY